MEFNRDAVYCGQQLNTKGCCFLCLETEDGNKNTEAERHLFSIRSLLRHLQITSFDMPILAGEDIEVNLCVLCQNTLKGFTNTWKKLEIVQIKMNYFLERISNTISCSKKDSKKVQIYSKRMTDDPKALAQLAFVDNLRKKLEVKSLAMQVGLIACIKIRRTEVKKKIQIKEEIDSTDDFLEIVEGNEVFDNDDQEASEHSEHISQSLRPVLKPIKKEEEAGVPEVEARKPWNSQSLCYIKIKETGLFKCKKCTKTCRSKVGILDHNRSVHLKKRFKCDICNISTYVKLTLLKMHQKTCRETLEERLAKERERKGFKFVCVLCGKRFRNTKGLADHRQIVHKNINRYACNLCDKKYKKLESLNGHMDAVHLGKKFYCRICKKGIRHKATLHRHEKICNYKQKIKTESQATNPTQ